MSLIPYLLHDFFHEPLSRPSRLMDQQFGLALCPEDLAEPLAIPSITSFQNYFRPWRTALQNLDKGSTITAEKDKFQISLDVQQFAPNEISVKTIDNNTIFIEGKHEEKQDEHGFISRHFTRRYILPPEYDIKNVQSSLSSDGVLTISAPKLAIEGNPSEKTIPIAQTGPAKAVEEKK